MVVSSAAAEPLPDDTEARLADFTDLAATAIANAESRAGLARLAEEQAALRRVATLVARAAPPEVLFAAVAEEVGRLLPVGLASLARYESYGALTVVADWSGRDESPYSVGVKLELGGKNLATLILQSLRPARIDRYADASGDIGKHMRAGGVHSAVGTPIIVDGNLWGLMVVSSTLEQPLPADTEARLTSFTDLLATAIANAESRAELGASRARIVTAADAARRGVERDLHDGAQQRLVSLGLELRSVQAEVPPGLPTMARSLSRVADGLADVQDELMEIARGLHPAILARGGLGPALRTLARRSPIPVELDVKIDERMAERVEVPAYYVVSEALTNAAKHAGASVVRVGVEAVERALRVFVHDDGVGGADPTRGSGLVGLKDRVEAFGGTIVVDSPLGEGTTLLVELPLDA
jgi:signal transduction histidine kinase